MQFEVTDRDIVFFSVGKMSHIKQYWQKVEDGLINLKSISKIKVQNIIPDA